MSDLNQWLRVEVTYTDDFGGHRVSATTSRAVGPGPPCAPANLKAAPGDGQVTLTWEAGCDNGQTIDRYQYRRLDVRKWVRVPGDGSARRQQVTGLTNGEAHTFEVRAGNRQEWGPAAQATATPAAAESPPPPPPLTVTYEASSYSAQEGGEAATVTVRLSPSADALVNIPISVTPGAETEEDDFTVAGLTDGGLSFAPEADEATFTITASEDADTVDETVTLGFGTPLPEGVSAGTTAEAVVSLVDDDDTPGEVTVRPETAQVGTELTATLSDADEVAEVTGWQWHRRASDQAAWTAVSGATAAAYTPVSSDAGQYLQATVGYTDGHGPDKSAASAAIGPVAESPEPPDLTVSFDRESYSASEGGTASVTVSVSPATDRALKIPISVTPDSETEEGDYTVTWPGVADTLWFESGATAQSFAIQANADPDSDDETVSLGFGTPLPAGVSAGTPSRATLTLGERPTGALVIVGTQDTTFAEGGTGIVAPYRALSADGQAVAPVSWSLGGADADTLTIDAAGRLRFEEPPDYENPADANRDTVYEVTVEADADGQPPADAALPVSVRVTDVDDPGEVTLISSSPRVGTPLTAVLTDQDGGIREDGWHWQHRDRDTDAWEPPLPAGRYPGLTSYTPQAGNAGKRLRATVGYADALGPDKRAQSDSTARVIHAQVFFGAESYQAAEGGAAATVTVRMEPAADRQLGIPIEATGEAGTESDDYSLGGLGSGNTLTFSDGDAARTFTITAKPDGDGDDGRVRLGFGSLPWQVTAGSPAGAAVTLVEPATNSPPNPPDGPTAVSFAENGTAAVASYRLSDPDAGDALALQKEGGADSSSFRVDAVRLYFKSAPDFEGTADADRNDVYEVSLRTHDGSLPSEPVTVSVTVTNVEEGPGRIEFLTGTPQVDVRVRGTLTDPDGNVDVRSQQWQRLGSSGWEPITPDEETRTPPSTYPGYVYYTPTEDDVGKRLRVTASYLDGASADEEDLKSAQSGETHPVAHPPLTVAFSSASYQASEGGSAATVTVRLSPASPGQVSIPIEVNPGSGTESGDYSVTGLTDGALRFAEGDRTKSFTIAADWDSDHANETVSLGFGSTLPEGVSPGTPSRATMTLADVNRPPVISGPESQPVPENRTTVATYRARDPEGDSVTWSDSGDDAGDFTIAGGALSFDPAPDYERPADAGGNNVYAVTVEATDDGGQSGTRPVTVTVTNVDEPGRLTVDSTPQVGTPATAVLTDPDGGIQVESWHWQWRARDTDPWEPPLPAGRYPGLTSFTPQAEHVGKRLRATVGYTDAQGPDKSAQSAATHPVPPPPLTVTFSSSSYQATEGGDGRTVTVRLSPAAHQQVSIRIEVNPGSGTESGDYRVSGLTNGALRFAEGDRTKSFTITANRDSDRDDESVSLGFGTLPSGVSAGSPARATVTLVDVNRPPVISGPESQSVPEKRTAVASYRVSDPDGDATRWLTLTGTNAGAFTFTGGALRFVRAPDYESDPRRYEVTVRATDGERPTDYPVTVTVTNVDEAGSVSLSTTRPQVGQRLLAELTDPDGGVTGASWRWQRLPPGPGSRQPESSTESVRAPGSTSPPYTPTSQDAGLVLRARVDYDDAHGPGKAAASGETAPVVTVPSVPRDFTAEAGNRQVALSWRAPVSDGGLSLTGYEYRRRAGGSWSGWTGVGTNTTRTVTGLSNGTRYRFEVRARNAAGAGAAASASATPVQPNRAPYFTRGPTSVSFAENGSGPVGRYTARDPDGDAITWSRTGTEASAFQLEGTGTTRTLTFDTAPDYEAGRSHQVTLEVSDGSLQAERTVRVRVTDEPEPPDPPSGVRVSAPDNMGHERLEVSWTAPDNRGRPALSGNDVHYCKTNEVFFCDSYGIWSSLTAGGSATGTLLTGLSAHTGYTVRVRARNAEGTSGWSARATGRTRSAAAKALAGQLARTGMKGLAALAAPNPFNPSTTLYFQLTETGEASLVVYSLAGQVVKTLIPNRTLKAGIHRVDWEGQDQQGRPVAAGVYLYRLAAGDQAIVRKMTLLR